MSEHTPGPWEIQEWKGDREKPMLQVRGELEHCNAQVCKMSSDSFGEMSPRNIADINLISAAPDMLEVLKGVSMEVDSGPGLYYFDEADIDAIAKAIAKAEGATNGGAVDES